MSKSIKDKVTPSLARIEKELKQLSKKATKFFVNKTPIDTGHAKRSTKLSGGKIKAKYKYATYLDVGWSKQAKRGMSKPTTEYITKLIKKLMRK
jgi:hypothetical protein